MRKAPTKWQLKREASYATLVDAAMRRFHEHGYAATRVEDIVEGTGYTAGAFYFHFQNKLDCFWQVIAHRQKLRGDWATLVQPLNPETTSLEQVLRTVIAHFRQTKDGRTAWILLMVDCFQQHHTDQDTLTRLHTTYNGWHDELVAFVEALQEGGWIPTGKDPAQLATQIFAYADGLNSHTRIYQLDPAAIEAALYNGLIALLTTPDPPPTPTASEPTQPSTDSTPSPPTTHSSAASSPSSPPPDRRPRRAA